MKPWGSAITVQNKAVVLDPVSNKAARRGDERRCASKLSGYLKKNVTPQSSAEMWE